MRGDRESGSVRGDRESGSLRGDRGSGSVRGDSGSGSVSGDRGSGSVRGGICVLIIQSDCSSEKGASVSMCSIKRVQLTKEMVHTQLNRKGHT